MKIQMAQQFLYRFTSIKLHAYPFQDVLIILK